MAPDPLLRWNGPERFRCSGCDAYGFGSLNVGLGFGVELLPPGWSVRWKHGEHGNRAVFYVCSAACAAVVNGREFGEANDGT